MLIRSIHFSLERWREANRAATVAERELARAQMAHCRDQGPPVSADRVAAVHELQRIEHELFRTVFEQLDHASASVCQRARACGSFHAQDEPAGEQGGTG